MKFNRTTNASRNIVFGIFQRIYQVIIPFIMRTAMIYWLGAEYLGLDSLFVSVLSVLNLAELGVGSAMIYSMYKPVAEDDKARICALMKLYKRYYRLIGLVVLAAGLLVCPFIPRLISGDIPAELNVYVLFLLNLGATVLSYWLFAYKNSLLQAYQRADVVSKVTMLVNTIRYAVQFAVLYFWHDYYIYLIVTLVSQAGINIVTAVVVDKMFPGYTAEGRVEDSEKKAIDHRIRDLFTAKIGAVVVNSVDTLVISAFLGLTALAIYQNYFFVITALLSIINIFIFSCTAGIGNSIIVDSREKCYCDFKTFTFLIVCIACICTSCLVCLYQPFMELWVGQELMLDFSAVVCFGIYFFVVQINTLLNMYKDAAGMWHEDRLRPLVTALANLAMNLIMVQFWGIYGVLLSTILSMLFVGMPWLVSNLFTTIFDKTEARGYVFLLFRYVLAAILSTVVSYSLGAQVPLHGILLMAVRAVICIVVSGIVILGLFSRTPEFKSAVIVTDRVTGNRLKLQKFFIR